MYGVCEVGEISNMKVFCKNVKAIVFVVFTCFAIMLTACSSLNTTQTASPTKTSPFVNRLTEIESGLVRDVSAYGSCKQAVITDFGKNQGFQLDVRWLDCDKDLNAEQQKMVYDGAPCITFNSNTIFPSMMPKDYDPATIIENGKNPGLGVRSLHENGITGAGIGIAIIDTVLYTGHPEYKDQLALYEEIHVTSDEGAQMHGSAVVSIAVGKNCGVAPGAKLYYWGGDLMKDAYSEGLAVAIDRVIEVNKNLPQNEKIRVISISKGFINRDEAGIKEFLAAVDRAKKANIFVVTTTTYQSYNWLNQDNNFGGLGKIDYTGDPDQLSTYTLGLREQGQPNDYISRLLVPMDARTTADFTGDGYVFYSEAGNSWVTPYVAGLYALACQVNPDITPKKFWKAARDTADKLTVKLPSSDGNDEQATYTLNYVVNPVKLIEAIK